MTERRLSARPLALAAAAAICGLLSPGAAHADAVSPARITAVADKAAAAWLPLVRADGSVTPPSKALVRSSAAVDGHNIELGLALLHAAGRKMSVLARHRLLTRGIAAVDLAYANAGESYPFPLLFLPLAYRQLRALPKEAARSTALARWAGWMNAQRTDSAVPEHPCYQDSDCYDNWDLVRAVGGLEALADSPPGTAAPATALFDRPATLLTASRVFNSALPGNAAPDVVSSWGIGPAASISDSPLYPTAYGLLSTALLGWAHARNPASFSDSGNLALAKAQNYARLVVAPDGDVALSGRSQLQSWTLSAAVLVAAARMREGGPDRAAWAAIADRALNRLSGPQYRYRRGLLAITPSARAGSLRGLDSYADGVGYSGLTLALLNMAAMLLPADPVEPASLPSDSNGLWADLGGAGVVTGRSGKVWWQWRTAAGGNDTLASGGKADFRGDPGLLQVKVETPRGWINLLDSRPVGATTAEAGPALMDGSKALAFDAASVTPVSDGAVIGGTFGSGSTAGPPTTLRLQVVGNSLQLSWPITAGAAYTGNLPLSAGAAAGGGLRSTGAQVTFSPTTAVKARPGYAPGASSVHTRLWQWTLKGGDAGIATVTLQPRS